MVFACFCNLLVGRFCNDFGSFAITERPYMALPKHLAKPKQVLQGLVFFAACSGKFYGGCHDLLAFHDVFVFWRGAVLGPAWWRMPGSAD